MAFGSVRTAGEIAQKIMEHLGFESELCLRQISPRSACSQCADICPVDAITIERSKVPGYMANMELDEDLCIQCGLCTTACPTGAFSWDNPNLMQLRNKIAKLIASEDTMVYITCNKTGIKDFSQSVVSVPCLGMIPWEFWLSLSSDFEGKFSVFLPNGLCENCEVSTGERMLIEEISQAEESSGKAINLVDDKRELEFFKKAKEEGYDASKRGFFTGLKDASKQLGSLAIETAIGSDPNIARPRSAAERFKEQQTLVKNQKQVLEEIEKAKEEGRDLDEIEMDSLSLVPLGSNAILTPRRKILLEVLKRHPEYAESSPVILPTVNNNCTNCNACAYMCPTEAITIGDKGIQMLSRFCTGCELCKEICFPHAINFELRNALVFNDTEPYPLREEAKDTSDLDSNPNLAPKPSMTASSYQGIGGIHPQNLEERLFNADKKESDEVVADAAD
ncbi:MAG: 4Fe-4S binding protein [Coriobacteriia bacterium]|nr:4Fe-4S binding protein [Coriobacteriia bacterium]